MGRSLGHETGFALGVAPGTGKRPFAVAGDGGFRTIARSFPAGPVNGATPR
jgi:indolepyruvate decarboxylase